MVKGDKFSKFQCPQNELQHKKMKNIPFASAVEGLMYAQICTHPNIAFTMGMLGRYQSDLGMDNQKAAKKVVHYLQRTKDFMLTYRRFDHFEVVGYSNFDFATCLDKRKFNQAMSLWLLEGLYHGKA